MSSTPAQLRIFPKQDDPNRIIREQIDLIFSDKFMLFLTFLMLPIIIIPLVIDLSADIAMFLYVCDFIIIVLFITEYSAKLYFAKNRYEYFRNPWHILDLVIIILSIIGFMPFYESTIPGSSFIFLRFFRFIRYARVSRIFATTGRSINNLVHTEEKTNSIHEKTQEIQIRIVTEKDRKVEDNISWDKFQQKINETTLKTPRWIDIHNISEENFSRLSEILDIPEVYYKNKFIQQTFPQTNFLENASLVFLQTGQINYPNEKNQKYLTIENKGFLIICKDKDIITLSKEGSEFFNDVYERLQSPKKNVSKSIVIEVLHGMLENIIQKYRNIIYNLERDLLEIESIPQSDLPSDFLEQTFQIKKELSNLSSNLLHFKEIISDVVNQKVVIEGFSEAWKDYFELLENDATALHESSENCKDNLLSIIDLYLNRNAYDTNKIMRVLAIVTTIAVVPAAISGILGQNLLNAPFGVMLWQVLVIIGLGISIILYIFWKLGWLKV